MIFGVTGMAPGKVGEEYFVELAVSVPEGRPITYGHLGDGNIHLIVVPPADFAKERRQALFLRVKAVIFGALDRFGGSISAGHGIGRSKKKAPMERVDPVTLDLMRSLKTALDPEHHLSRGRIFDA